MPELNRELDPTAARDWIARWDRQQEVYLPDREERFTALIDAVAAGTGRADPLVLDLGCGPGSLAVRLLARIPAATVIAADADPVTLTLGRAGYADVRGLRFLNVDLRAAGLGDGLGLDPGRQVDAVVSTTALHWLTAAELRELYQVLARLLRPGGLFLDGDHLRLTETEARYSQSWTRSWRRPRTSAASPPATPPTRRTGGNGGRPSPRIPPLLTRPPSANGARCTTTGQRARCSLSHTAALRAAGFAEIGTLWQRGSNRLLCGVR